MEGVSEGTQALNNQDEADRLAEKLKIAKAAKAKDVSITGSSSSAIVPKAEAMLVFLLTHLPLKTYVNPDDLPKFFYFSYNMFIS